MPKPWLANFDMLKSLSVIAKAILVALACSEANADTIQNCGLLQKYRRCCPPLQD